MAGRSSVIPEGAANTNAAPPDWGGMFWQGLSDYALLVVDASQCIVAWSPGAERLFGHQAGDIIGQPFSVLLGVEAPAKAGQLSPGCQPDTNPQSWRTERYLVRKDGSRFYAGISSTRFADAGSNIGMAVVDDTVHEVGRLELVRRNEAFNKTEHIAGLGHWELDLLDSDHPERNALRWSDETYRIFGFEPGSVEVTNDLFFSAVHPDDREAIETAMGAALASGAEYSIQHRIVLANGDVRVVHERGDISRRADGQVSLLLGTVLDVTVADGLAREVLATRAHLQLVLDNIPHFVFWKDQNSIYQGCNHIFAIQGGLASPAAIVGLSDYDLVPAGEAALFQSMDRAVMEQDTPQLGILESITRPDGTVHWLETNKIPLHDSESGAVLGILGTYADVTERIATQLELEQSRAALVDLNRSLEERVRERTTELTNVNKDLEAFANTVSHDLRTPLRHIDGFIELLKVDLEPVLSEGARRRMNIIGEGARRMTSLIDGLLEFSRHARTDLHLERFPLEPLVREVIEELESAYPSRAITWEIGVLPAVTADRALFRLVWQNLLQNALKFTRDRAETRIAIGYETLEPGLDQFSVADNGVGFQMEFASRVFGMFQRLHSEAEFAGTGIGLANVQRIIERHGGTVWAEGEPGVGATFSFTLPRSA
ncbi:MAG: PAS domain S-box protein [bacterium]